MTNVQEMKREEQREEKRKIRNEEDGWTDGVFSPGTMMVHAAYTPLTDPAVMRSGRSVGFAATAHRPAFAALKTAGQIIQLQL